jgi:membrane-bound serine protease (ClpP class)
MTGIQNRYGRNVPLATSMVTAAKSYDDATAVSEHIVDLGGADATTLGVLLNTIDHRSVRLDSGQTVILQTAGASIQTLGTNVFDSLYAFLLDPNVVFLLFIVAMIGIYLEISHPGAILPGVAGAIALLLFLFAAGSLSPNWAGLALMVLAFVLLILDMLLPTHGVLTLGAVISLIVGSLIFFNSGGPYNGPQVNPLVVYIMGAVIGLLGLFIVGFILRTRSKHASTGTESMIGTNVLALTPLLPEGRVSYEGEDWAAILDPTTATADIGTQLQIIAVEGLHLRVRHVHSSHLVDALPILSLE